MTIRQAAALLNVHLSTLRRWEKSGQLVSTRVGPRGHRRYSRDHILELVAGHSDHSQAEAAQL
ncbi:MAG: MerR family transcriptional regulator [Candidatus Dormibacteria bacterium]